MGKNMAKKSKEKQLAEENRELRAKLEELEETLHAIQSGEGGCARSLRATGETGSHPKRAHGFGDFGVGDSGP